ncbi:XRE family transcriptional regulator [Streptomyces sp. CA-243310]|uniref:XRE family transcriptional regulator n=1 Tax=Streptomyces sp. CA-243310 TaxID=3240056 RepID=UPI003D9073A8
MRRRLAVLGAGPSVLALLDPAMDADRIITAVLASGDDAAHPLGEWVHNRQTAHMLAWALTGTAPSSVADLLAAPRRGPAAAAPLLDVDARRVFFDRLRNTAETASRTGAGGILLHRQALYLPSYDRSPQAIAWTAHALHAGRGALAGRGWTPRWAEARSTAAALARLGDPVPLWDFIERAMADDDDGEAANLNYWAYWLGVAHQPQADDAFMRDRDLTGLDPVALLRALADGMHFAPGYVDLYTYSMWSLLHAHPWLPEALPSLSVSLAERLDRLLDEGGISPRSRRELASIHYVLHQNR